MIVDSFGFPIVEVTEDAFTANPVSLSGLIGDLVSPARDPDEYPSSVDGIGRPFDVSAPLEPVDEFGHGTGRTDDLLGQQGGRESSLGCPLQETQNRILGEGEPVAAEAVTLERLQEEAGPRECGEEAERTGFARVCDVLPASAFGPLGSGPARGSGGSGHRRSPVDSGFENHAAGGCRGRGRSAGVAY